MDSIIEKICEAESLGIHYVFMGIESQYNEKPNAWLQCSKHGYTFVESSSLLQIFTEYCNKENFEANHMLYSRLNESTYFINEEIKKTNFSPVEMHDDIIKESMIEKKQNELIINSSKILSTLSLDGIGVDDYQKKKIKTNNSNITPLKKSNISKNLTIPLLIQDNIDIKNSFNEINIFSKKNFKPLNNSKTLIPNEASQLNRRSIRSNRNKNYRLLMDSNNSPLKINSKNLLSTNILKSKETIFIKNEDKIKSEFLEKNLECSFCEKKFNSQNSLNLHSWVHKKESIDNIAPNISYDNDKDMFICNDCGKLFPFKEIASMHAWRHRNGNIDNKVRLGMHIPENERSYLCDDCGKRFATLESARGHYRRVHQIDMKSYSCSKCGRALKSASSLRLHLKFVHSAEAKYSCNKCSKTFKWKAGLSRHIEEHLLKEKGIEPSHTCNHCCKVFQTIARLRIHKYNIRVNKQRKENSAHRYLCFVCGSGFFLNCDLQTHIHIRHPHENLEGRFTQGYIMKHVCSVCNKICADKSKLKSHMRCHTGEKPFICQYCGKAFAHKHYLKKHNRNLFCLNQKDHK